MQHNIFRASYYLFQKTRYGLYPTDKNASKLQKSSDDLVFFLNKMGCTRKSDQVSKNTAKLLPNNAISAVVPLVENAIVQMPVVEVHADEVHHSRDDPIDLLLNPNYVFTVVNGNPIFVAKQIIDDARNEQAAKREFFDNLRLAEETMSPEAYEVHRALFFEKRGLFMSSPSQSREIEFDVLPKFAVLAIHEKKPLSQIIIEDPTAELFALAKKEAAEGYPSILNSFIFSEDGTKVQLAASMVAHMEERLKKAFPHIFKQIPELSSPSLALQLLD